MVEQDGAFDHSQLDDLIHSRIRLAVIAVLASVERAEFTFIRDKVNTTDGNLSTHLRKLEDASYVEVTKTIEGRTPATYVGITAKGKAAYAQYRVALRELLTGLP